jgi:amino acid permease
MRWILLLFGSLATGVLTIVLSLALVLVSLSIYDRYVLGIASNGSVGWDPVSIYGKPAVISIPLLIFSFGCSVGFFSLNKRLHR